MATTPKPRTTPGINQSTVNPVYKAVSTVTSYVKNVGKEYGEWRTAMPKSKDGKAMPEAGQAWGALLQGRRYTKGGTQVK